VVWKLPPLDSILVVNWTCIRNLDDVFCETKIIVSEILQEFASSNLALRTILIL